MSLLPNDYGLPCPLPNPTNPESISRGSIPGPKGDPGVGTPGANGSNAFSLLTAGVTAPVSGSNVLVNVDSSAWMVLGQIVFVQFGGFYTVASLPSLTSAMLTNLGYAGNAAAGAIIANGSKIAPAGPMGPAGSLGGAAGGDLTGNYPDPALAASGVTAGTGTKVTVDVKGRVTSLTNLAAGDVPAIPASKITSGTIPVANGGTGSTTATAGFNALSPATTKGDLILSNGASSVRQGVGTDGQVLTADSTSANGARWTTPSAFTLTQLAKTAVVATPYVMLATDVLMAVNIAGAATATLLSAPADGRLAIVKDASGAAGTHNITILAGSGDTIEGGSSATISNNYGVAFLCYDLPNRKWYFLSKI